MVRLEIRTLLLLFCEEPSWKRSSRQHTAKVLAIFEPITFCHTIHDTDTVISVGQNSDFPQSTTGSPKCSCGNSGAVVTLHADLTASRILLSCVAVCRGTRVSELTSFQAHVSLKHLPCCLAKFRAWPTRLTWLGNTNLKTSPSAQTPNHISTLGFERLRCRHRIG